MTKHISTLLAAIVAFGIIGTASEASAKTFCMGAAYANASPESRAKLEAELRKQGRLGAGDSLAACSAPAAMSGKPNPRKKKQCLSDCEVIRVGIEIACGIFGNALLPGFGPTVCGLATKGAQNVCPMTCERKYG